jgi:CO/xanthine dehydrogenase Mo-binding subunit
MIYDASGQCLTASLMDYAIAKPDMLPSFELDRVGAAIQAAKARRRSV